MLKFGFYINIEYESSICLMSHVMQPLVMLPFITCQIEAQSTENLKDIKIEWKIS